MQDVDQRDRELLGALQSEIPLVGTPYAVVGQSVDMSEKEVIKRIERLKREGVVRQLCGQFDSRALGYRSCLVAARVKEERIDEAAAIINAHPGVTQNYRRNDTQNLWFTIAISPLSRIGLDRTIDILGAEAGCESIRSLPALKVYKSGGQDTDGHSGDEPHVEATVPTTVEIECVRLLQRDLPLQPRPFEALARGSSITADELLATARALLKRGQMRSFAAALAPRKSGFVANAMALWSAPADRVDDVGQKMAKHRAVSHCYLRPAYDDWPYNIYTIVHGRSVDECESVINDLAIDTELAERRVLYPVREYRKARLSLFSHEAEEWEAAHDAGRKATVAS